MTLLLTGPMAHALSVEGACCEQAPAELTVEPAHSCCAQEAESPAPSDDTPAPCRGDAHCPKSCCWTPPVVAIRAVTTLCEWTVHIEPVAVVTRQIDARVVAFDLLRPPRS